jgi:hypothetical protein
MKYIKMLILGRSGSGKTSSLRGLDPAKTAIINCDKQELPFVKPGYEMNTNAGGFPDSATSNYVETSKPSSVLATLDAWEAREDIDTIVIDTLTHLMTAYYITDAIGKEFGGYRELGTSFWQIIDKVRDLKKNVIVFGHIKTEFNDLGDRVSEMRSHGKMIKDFEPESYFNILLMAEIKKLDGEVRWIFRTQPENASEKLKCPSKFGDDDSIEKAFLPVEDNDVQMLFDKLHTFYNS